MNTRFVRVNSTDGIELDGLIYTPNEPTNKVIIHVFGLNGNFYENRFLDYLADTYTKKGYAFLTINNRGKEYFSDFVKNGESVLIGGSLERFEECVYDIDGAVKWCEENNYNEIILQGHSYGCNKVLYYYDKVKNSNIKKIILLGPCDIMAEVIRCYTPLDYESIKEEALRLVNDGKDEELIRCDFMSTGKVSAKTYLDFLPNSPADFIRYREGEDSRSELLNKIDIPVLSIFGDIDECVLTRPIEEVLKYLNNNFKNINNQVISGANHSFTDKYNELVEVINNNL